jgi:cell division protein FtsB
MSKVRGVRRRTIGWRRIVIVGCSVCFLAWAVGVWLDQRASLLAIAQEREVLQKQLLRAQAEHVEYVVQKKRLHDAEYVEQTVRKQYGMHRVDDVLFAE